jgi:Tfp pilus assembly protein PilX
MITKNKLILQSQSGAALVIALIILVVLTAITLSSSITSITEIKLSGNKRANTDAFYTADGGVQATFANFDNFKSDTYTPLVGSTAGISPDIISQGVDSMLTPPTFASGVAFTTSPTVVIYHETNTGAPRGGGWPADGSVGYEYYIIDSTGRDQAGLGSNSQVVTTVFRVYPVQ